MCYEVSEYNIHQLCVTNKGDACTKYDKRFIEGSHLRETVPQNPKEHMIAILIAFSKL